MKDIVLTGKQIDAFREALAKAYKLKGLEQMLMIELDKDLENIVERGAGKDVVFDLIRVAQREGWLYRLLKAARAQNKGNPQLTAFEQGISISTRDYGKSGLEALINVMDEFFDLNEWLPKLIAIEKQVCKVEVTVPDKTKRTVGTGFLVAPDLVLTNHHVVEEVIEDSSADIKLRFDYRKINPIDPEGDGEVYTLADKWCIAESPFRKKGNEKNELPTHEELDYALLRLKEPLTERGFIKMPMIDNLFEFNFDEDRPLFIVQHPLGAPLKLAIDSKGIIGLNANKTRLFYKTRTEGGSSGSPCFNAHWELIALHHYGEKDVKNGGIPITTILEDLKKKGIEL